MLRNCQSCGKDFEQPQLRGRPRNFCYDCVPGGIKPQEYFRKQRPDKRCQHCNQVFERSNERGAAIYCRTCVPYRDRFAIGLMHSYKISRPEYDAIIAEQDNRCGLCQKPFSECVGVAKNGIIIDHDHETGEMRGLLCQWCNIKISAFEQSVDWQARAQDWVKNKRCPGHYYRYNERDKRERFARKA